MRIKTARHCGTATEDTWRQLYRTLSAAVHVGEKSAYAYVEHTAVVSERTGMADRYETRRKGHNWHWPAATR